MANSSSQNLGGIDNFILSNFNAKDGNVLAYVDFTENSDAQVFAVKTLSTSGTIINSLGDYVIEFAVYNFGEDDKFVYGGKLSDFQKEWVYFYSDDGSKLIDWSDIVENFYANFEGQTYYAYTLVPEPSAYAIIAAIFALIFLIFKKTKKLIPKE